MFVLALCLVFLVVADTDIIFSSCNLFYLSFFVFPSPNRHHIAQMCRAISSKLGTYRQSEKKLVKHQYLVHMSSQYGELRLTND